MRHLGTQPHWFSLSGNVKYPAGIAEKYNEVMKESVGSFEQDFARRLALGKYLVTPMVVQPKGLENKNFSCFSNSSIQLLFASPPFVSFANFMRTNLPLFSPQQRNVVPSWISLCQFLNRFHFAEATHSDGGFTSIKSLELVGSGGVTNTFCLNQVFGPFSSTRKPLQQEDASEFLSYFLNTLHDELIKLMELSPIPEEERDQGGWMTKGKGRMVTVVDTQGKLSPLSKIFATFVRAETLENHKSRSVNAEVNLVLQLPIMNVKTLEEAIQEFIREEHIPGTSISKKNSYTSLPMSLIIGLMRFGYNEYGQTKLTKLIEYPQKLHMEADAGRECAQYQLCAVVVHKGPSPAGGHYICFSRRFDGTWMEFDDQKVTTVDEGIVLEQQAYMLLYNRITSTTSPNE